MSLGQPNVKRALDWILERLAEEQGAKRAALIDQAAREFDLTPLESEFLYRQLIEATKDKKP
jgi:hypothetical protein